MVAPAQWGGRPHSFFAPEWLGSQFVRWTIPTSAPRLRSSTTRVHVMSKGIKRIHSRIVAGGVILLVAFLAWAFLLDGMASFTSVTHKR